MAPNAASVASENTGADARLRTRFEFWFFSYDSGNPIAYSGMQLREGLAQAVARADPAGADPCVRDMIVLGHSQGGLLTKLTAIDAGDVFWRNISDEPFEAAELPPETEDLLRRALFPTPLPFVSEVIFLATPQRGSYLAGPQLVRLLRNFNGYAPDFRAASDAIELEPDRTA